jgi:hypothetical protein
MAWCSRIELKYLSKQNIENSTLMLTVSTSASRVLLRKREYSDQVADFYWYVPQFINYRSIFAKYELLTYKMSVVRIEEGYGDVVICTNAIIYVTATF